MSPIAGEVVEGVVKGVAGGLDGLLTSDDERLKRANEAEAIRQRPGLAQIETNRQEAAHPSIFVAGWRPAIGWTCAAALAWEYILRGMGNYALLFLRPEAPALPSADMTQLIPLVVAMLGFGYMRSLDKQSGKGCGS